MKKQVERYSARPYESSKIFKGRPRRNAFSKLEIQNTTGLSSKPSTASYCAEDQILENKNLRNMIL